MIDINDFRAWHTVVLMTLFIGIFFWAYSGGRRKRFDEAANLPFADENLHQKTIAELAEEESKEEKKS